MPTPIRASPAMTQRHDRFQGNHMGSPPGTDSTESAGDEEDTVIAVGLAVKVSSGDTCAGRLAVGLAECGRGSRGTGVGSGLGAGDGDKGMADARPVGDAVTVVAGVLLGEGVASVGESMTMGDGDGVKEG